MITAGVLAGKPMGRKENRKRQGKEIFNDVSSAQLHDGKWLRCRKKI